MDSSATPQVSKRWLGVHLNNHGTLTLEDMIACGRLADHLGYSGLTMNEDVGHDSFALLAALAGLTHGISLGTAITNVYVRTAMQVAMGAATVDQLSTGRAALGLSIGHHPWNDVYHGVPFDPPLPRLREYVNFVRGVLSGETYEHDGTIFRGVRAKLGFKPYRPTLPVFLAGDRAGVLRLAGQVADGAILNAVGAEYIGSFAVDRVRTAALEAGRDPASVEITVIVTCCLSEDWDEALVSAKQAFIGRLRGSPEKMMATRPAAKEELGALVQLVQAGNTDRAMTEVSHEIVADTVAAGSAEAVREAVLRFYRAGATRVLLASAPGTRGAIEALLRAMQPLIADQPATALT